MAEKDKGRGGKRNYPSARPRAETDEDKALFSKFLKETYVAYKKERVRSDDELKQRLNDYFKYCAEENVVPTVEEMAMWTGYSIQTVGDWEHGRNKGFSSETSNIIKKAKNFLQTFDAKLAISGKMNFLAYCFRAKNYYGMSDKQEITVTPNNPLGDNLSTEDIQQRLLEETGNVIDIPAIAEEKEKLKR